MSREIIVLRRIEAELRRGDRTREDICRKFGICDRTLRRYVGELQQAGGRYKPRKDRRGSARVHLWSCTREVFRHD